MLANYSAVVVLKQGNKKQRLLRQFTIIKALLYPFLSSKKNLKSIKTSSYACLGIGSNFRSPRVLLQGT
jgi:hypothetical protein